MDFLSILIIFFKEVYKRYKDVAFKIGEDDSGKKIRIKLKYYFEYLVHQVIY